MNRHPPSPPVALGLVEPAGDPMTATSAAVPLQVVGRDGVPVSPDDHLAAAGAVRALTARVHYIPRVDVLQLGLQAQLAPQRHDLIGEPLRGLRIEMIQALQLVGRPTPTGSMIS
jgi:hypothetical protein